MATLHLPFITAILFIIYKSNIETYKIPIISTECGPVKGQYIDGAYSFRGIPYAEPPTRSRRWKPPKELNPQEFNCWRGTYQALKYGSSCFQRNFFDVSKFMGSEDCLYMNVITPSIDPYAAKPVMVWIHGGYLQYLDGNWPLYRPTEKLAAETDMVYVSFNYRLQAFGFMALQVLADQSPTNTSGNYGFMDMLAVLKWVQTNIRNFGGDPNQVTVFGQSSGGTSIFALLASPLSAGLFHKAWLISASAILNKTATDAYKDNELFLNNTGCSDVHCLLRLTPEQVTKAVPWDEYPYWAMTDQGDLPVKGYFDGALPIIDGVVLHEAPFDAWANGNAIDVPILIGTTENEVDFLPTQVAVTNWTWTQYEDHLSATLRTFGPLVLNTAKKLYPSNHVTPQYQLTSIISDLRINCPNDVLAMYLASNVKSPVYRYVVTSFPSVPVNFIGIQFPARYAFHGWDSAAFFGNVPDYIANPTAEDMEWQTNVRTEVLSFIRTGKPRSAEWRTYPDVTALLSHTTIPTNAFHPVQCEFLLHNGLFSYSWLN